MKAPDVEDWHFREAPTMLLSLGPRAAGYSIEGARMWVHTQTELGDGHYEPVPEQSHPDWQPRR